MESAQSNSPFKQLHHIRVLTRRINQQGRSVQCAKVVQAAVVASKRRRPSLWMLETLVEARNDDGQMLLEHRPMSSRCIGAKISSYTLLWLPSLFFFVELRFSY